MGTTTVRRHSTVQHHVHGEHVPDRHARHGGTETRLRHQHRQHRVPYPVPAIDHVRSDQGTCRCMWAVHYICGVGSGRGLIFRDGFYVGRRDFTVTPLTVTDPPYFYVVEPRLRFRADFFLSYGVYQSRVHFVCLFHAHRRNSSRSLAEN